MNICRSCDVLHYDNCPSCFGFGMLNLFSNSPVSAEERLGVIESGKWKPCLECFSTPMGLPYGENESDDVSVHLSDYIRLYERYSKLTCFIGQLGCYCPSRLTMDGSHFDHCMLGPVEKAIKLLEKDGGLRDYGFWNEERNLGYFGQELL